MNQIVLESGGRRVTIKLRKHAAAAVLAVVTGGAGSHALAEANTYGIFDGSKYKPEQLALAARSPVMMEAPRFEKNAYYVPRSPDGHYYVAGTLNNFPVVFLVDTGATYTTIPLQLAQNSGLRAGRQVGTSTANGESAAWVSESNVMTVGPFTAKNSTVAVSKALQFPLLGADILNRFRVVYANGYMILQIPG
ncbi:aspartyl protease-like protein (plasmid) [Burkholderia vietnamiensis G4]|uniref:Aspartyl protease-like protein n=1 Tax=Burkholderia vietnamiensis (strain G4 / LMG 22486) TaxID=269482 RepID=A4JUB3_BURVG|nr:aspartyl protease-like protein [Burkholderia vietnamiensis G4]